MDDTDVPKMSQVPLWEEDVVNYLLALARWDDRDVVDDPPFDEARDILEVNDA